MQIITQKRKMILLAVVFNLIMELWVWGITGFFNPIFIISIFFMYLSFFSMLVDLLVRFNLRDYHIILFGFFFGVFQETFGNGSTFNNPNFLGVNLINIALINVVWWGIMQGVFTIYFANRIVKFNKENAKKMGKIGWGFAIGFIVFMFLARVLKKDLPDATPIAYMISVALMLASFLIFLLLKKKQPIKIVEKIKFIDILIIIQIILSVLMGILHLVIESIIPVYFFIFWSLFIFLAYIVVRLKGKVLAG